MSGIAKLLYISFYLSLILPLNKLYIQDDVCAMNIHDDKYTEYVALKEKHNKNNKKYIYQ